jgi:hypothetical protein
MQDNSSDIMLITFLLTMCNILDHIFLKTWIRRNILSMYSSKEVIGYISYYYNSVKENMFIGKHR